MGAPHFRFSETVGVFFVLGHFKYIIFSWKFVVMKTKFWIWGGVVWPHWLMRYHRPPRLIPHYCSVCFIKCMDWDLAHRYAIFVSSLDVEIITNSHRSVQDYLVGHLTNWDWVLDWTLTQKFPGYDFFEETAKGRSKNIGWVHLAAA